MTLTAFPPPDPNTVATRSAAPVPAAPTLPPRSAPAPVEPRPSLPRSLGPAPQNQLPRKSGRVTSLVLVLAGLAVVMVVLAVAALPVLQDDDETEPAGVTTSPSGSLELRPVPTAAPSSETPDPAAVAETPTPVPEAPVAETVVVEAQPVLTVAPVPEVAPAEVPESKAVVRGGQIFLEGAVPTAESGELIATLAAEILGPDNVFNNYVVDPRASDPNLGNVTVEGTINFATGSSWILPESQGLLNQALALMTIRPSVTVIVVGHTDSRGTDEYNLELSVQRAEAVRTWLTDRGIEGNRLTVVGKGESEPIADNSTSAGQRLNRRIQYFLENLLADS